MDKQELLNFYENSRSVFDFEGKAKSDWRTGRYDWITKNISGEELTKIIKKLAITEAKSSIYRVIERGEEPEHCLVYDWTLAYGINQGAVSMEKARKITFETGDSLEAFLKVDAEKHIESIVQKILSAKTEPSTLPDYVPCCDGRPCTC